MKFILFSESGWSYLERMTYRGVIGLFYNSTLAGIAAYLIFALFFILALIGAGTIIKWAWLKLTHKRAHYF